MCEKSEKITLYDILFPIEQSLFEGAEKSLENIPQVPSFAINKLVFALLDKAVAKTLKSVSITDLAAEVKDMRT